MGFNRNFDENDKDSVVWSDRKRNALGLPWTFTKYTLTKDRLYINKGFLRAQRMR